jgi:hypothetical protein
MATLLPNDDVPREKMRGYRIFVWSQDHENPPHVHVRKGKEYSTWDLRSLKCVESGKFSSSQLRSQRKLLQDFYDQIVESWHDHWKNKKTAE